MSLEDVKDKFVEHVMRLQDVICQELRRVDPKIHLNEDDWTRKDFKDNDGGGGRTRAFSGDLIENAGVNFSKVYGVVNPEFAQNFGHTDGLEMWASGLSLIIHPRNPRIPTTHANFRMIQMGEKYWFGGGADLTPYYPYFEDFEFYHRYWKEVLTPYGKYQEWKKNCDEYFVNQHRGNEMRGIGGFFYDHYLGDSLEGDLHMIQDISDKFIGSYFPLVEKRLDEKFDSEDEDFMLHRRGRYVEFNLLHDRGTMFGLKSKGRTESILISLPARCKFSYDYKPKEGSIHQEMMPYYFARDW